jgi:hypothetical protein
MSDNSIPSQSLNPPSEQQEQPIQPQGQQNSNNIPASLLRQLLEAVKPPSSSIKVPEPTKFTSDSTQHAGAFIRTMETYFELTSNGDSNRYSDSKKIGTVLLQTGGLAQVWVQTFIDTYPHSTWDNFRTNFLQRFVPANQSEEALRFLQEHIRVLSRPDLKHAIDQYTEMFLQKKQLITGVNEQTFALLYQQHLPRTLYGYVENKIREWQASHPAAMAMNEGQPPLVDVISYTNQSIPLCQSVWTATERRSATKKDSFTRTSSVAALQSVPVAAEPTSTNSHDDATASAITTFNSNRGGNMRGSGRFRGAARQNSVPQWVLDHCRQNRLCFRCKEAFPGTHTPGQLCRRAAKKLDDKLRPQSN